MGKSFHILACLIIFIVCVCTNPHKSNLIPNTDECGSFSQPRVIGGEEAGIEDYPWLALLEYKTVEGQLLIQHCHGSIINKNYILTAAHCLRLVGKHKNTKLQSVRLGEYNLNEEEDCVNIGRVTQCAPPTMSIPVEKIIIHENFTRFGRNRHNDIGLIRLAFSIPYSEFVKPICLPWDNIILRSFVFISGWGETNGGVKSSIKLKAGLSLRPNSDCTYNGKYNITENHLCAGNNLIDSCKGDSGSPLMTVAANGSNVVMAIIGIVSFGPWPCAQEDMPGVYTNVIKYTDWIISKLEP